MAEAAFYSRRRELISIRVGRTSKEDRMKLRPLPRPADTTGLTAGYGVIVRRDCANNLRLLTHEFVHVAQYERWEERDFLQEYIQQRRLLGRASMQEFSLFERSLILSKDGRSPGRGPTSLRRQVPIAGQTADSSVASASKNRPLRADVAQALLGGGGSGDGGEVLGHHTSKSIPRNQD